MILNQRTLTFPSLEQGGVDISEPPKSEALWYDPNGAFATDGGHLYAWRAQNSPGTIWPGGPANYAATLTDQASGVVLLEGNGAVPWGAATGWGFVTIALQYFDTGLVPANDQSWSMFIQYANDTSNDARLAGKNDGGVSRIFQVRIRQGANIMQPANGAQTPIAPHLATGNYGVSGDVGCRNGVTEGAIGIWGGGFGLVYIHWRYE